MHVPVNSLQAPTVLVIVTLSSYTEAQKQTNQTAIILSE